jgi:hypothetical protein
MYIPWDAERPWVEFKPLVMLGHSGPRYSNERAEDEYLLL